MGIDLNFQVDELPLLMLATNQKQLFISLLDETCFKRIDPNI